GTRHTFPVWGTQSLLAQSPREAQPAFLVVGCSWCSERHCRAYGKANSVYCPVAARAAAFLTPVRGSLVPDHQRHQCCAGAPAHNGADGGVRGQSATAVHPCPIAFIALRVESCLYDNYKVATKGTHASWGKKVTGGGTFRPLELSVEITRTAVAACFTIFRGGAFHENPARRFDPFCCPGWRPYPGSCSADAGARLPATTTT